MLPLVNPKEFTKEILESLGYRVYLSNSGREIKNHPVSKKQPHVVDWVGFFVPPNYDISQCKNWVPMHSWSIERLIQWSKDTGELSRSDGLIFEAIDHFMGKVPDSTSLQYSYEGKLRGVMTPDEIVEEVRQLVDKWFPPLQFNDKVAPKAKYKNKFLQTPIEICLPIRVVASLVCIAFACEEANRGDAWYIRFHKIAREPKIAGCLMALGVYLYRRYTNASINQIATVLRIPRWE
jgi:hypothetical protein